MLDADVVDLLGQPDKTYATEYNRHLQYFALAIDFWFIDDADDPDDGRLHWIECANPEATLLGESIVGVARDEALEMLDDRLGDEVEVEDYGSFESYHFDEGELELQFEYGVVRSVNFGNVFGPDDAPSWPTT